MAQTAELILASASLRRRRILEELGVPFRVVITNAVELAELDNPAETARENAHRKYIACRALHPSDFIIAADTVVALNGKLLGKPESKSQAVSMLRALSGRSHAVHTAVVLANPGAAPVVQVCTSGVRFRELSDDAIQTYLSLVDPLDKAGAYDIDDHGEILVESHTGSKTNVMGLPVEWVRPWLQSAKIL